MKPSLDELTSVIENEPQAFAAILYYQWENDFRLSEFNRVLASSIIENKARNLQHHIDKAESS